ncbi:permease (plasmid) [Gemmatirosa kalamazoonensis]|uniref:Permease n=1 Tax=Gemmatirosa kalamazoonensis TaxID=861299 RepID=W0RPM3_9BACT|nr:ABC transporter permease [Gemmatirosa kalamazoonensis]AHG92954.1 permease [Gemmatirosa kalamazoonensis]
MPLGPDWLRERRFWRAAPDRDVDDELAFHLAMRAQLNESAGMDAQTARDAALARFGDVSEVRARCITLSNERERRMRRVELWSAARQHARYAFRRLRGAPGFAAAVVAMLALGIGATTTVFGVVDGILIRPLPFADPSRLVGLTHSIQIAGLSVVQQSDASFLLYQRHTRAFDGIAVWRTRDVNVAATDASAGAERVEAAGVSATFFPVLGVRPRAGRTFVEGEDRLGAPPIVVLSEPLWRRKFGADPAIVGKRVVVDGQPREVVGVMPAAFRYPSASIAIWYPLPLDPPHANPGSFNYTAVARLKPGVTPGAARADLARVLPRLLDEFPSDIPRAMFEQAHVTPIVTPLRDVLVGDVTRMLWLLLGAVVLLLLVACANVASLFLVRAEGAQRDLAVRNALGAGAGAIVAQYFGEAAVLAAAGGALGVALAAAGMAALHRLPSGVDLPRLAEVGVDARVVLFALVVSVLGALVVSLMPVLRARRIAPAVVLKESSRSATAGRDRQRARSALVVAQVALALVLVAGSALMARSFARLRDVSPGFEADGLFTMRVALPQATYTDGARALAFYDRVLAEARAIPGVRDATVTEWLPLTGDHNDSAMEIEDHPLAEGEVPPDHPLVFVTPEYFRTMRVPLLAGRTFTPVDAQHLPLEVLVSRAFARQYWPGKNPIGKRVRQGLTKTWYTVVGVAGDVHLEALEKPAEQAIYFPLAIPDDSGRADVTRAATIVVRTAGDPSRLAGPLRAAVRRVDPAIPTYAEQPMSAVLGASAARTRFVLLMLGVASLVALAIGAVGLYGVLAYGVTLRRREIGVRIALGAGRTHVSRMIARRGIALACAGVGVGLVGAIAATRVLHGLLYDVSPTDPVALAATTMVLLGVALLASWLPARRAAAVDPMEALRRD